MTDLETTTVLAGAVWAAAGAATWTLLEHRIHEGLGHRNALNNPFGVEHIRHHATTHYFAAAWKKAGAALPVVLGAWGLFARVMGMAAGTAYAAGLAGMYLAYEVAHRRFHTQPPAGPFGRMMRRHHFHHHFHDPRSNFGVTSMLWDRVFRTWVPAARIRVPAKHAMPWLVDPRTGRVRDEFAADYELARPAPLALAEAAFPDRFL